MQITCCDVEKAVIGEFVKSNDERTSADTQSSARNIFLLTLLIDEDPNNANNELLFKLAFDMVLDEETFDLTRPWQPD